MRQSDKLKNLTLSSLIRSFYVILITIKTSYASFVAGFQHQLYDNQMI
jgi:hypothetical protein